MNKKFKKWIYGGTLALCMMIVMSYTFANSNKPELAHADQQASGTVASSDVGVSSGIAPAPTDDVISNGLSQLHTINVSGEGSISVVPDVAYVTFGLSTNATTAKEAQSLNAKSFVDIQKVLTNNYKLTAKDILTTGFFVQPVYVYPNNEDPKITGYNAVQNIQVTYRNLTNIGALLDDLASAGVNQFNGIQFDTEKRQDYELQAIDSAMSNADMKAKAIAQHAGQTIKGIINVSLNGDSGPVPPIYNGVAIKAAASDASSPTTSISPGSLKITTYVSVEYAF